MHAPSLAPLLLLPLVGLSLPASKPCVPPLGASRETLMARAEVARGLAGTETVTLDDSCINISVRTAGTARLVELLLRGVEVPAEAVRFQIDSSAVPAGAARHS